MKAKKTRKAKVKNLTLSAAQAKSTKGGSMFEEIVRLQGELLSKQAGATTSTKPPPPSQPTK